MAKDLYHDNVRQALEKDGWLITHDPYHINIEDIGYQIDFGAESILGAERDNIKIAVEVKSFAGSSAVNEFHKAVGQFNDYYVALEMEDPNRILFLAVPLKAWLRFFQKQIIQKSLERIDAKIVIYNQENNEIVKWIK